MDLSPDLKTSKEHPFQAFLNQQVPEYRPMNDMDAQPNSTRRTLSPRELERMIDQHQQWLESDDYQKWLRTKTEDRNRYVQGRADLSRCDLQHVNLDHANLCEAILWQADLKGASLKHVNLEKADLWGVNFKEANLYRARLMHADAWDVNLANANLYGANLQNAAMGGSNFQNACLVNAELQHAYLGECNFQKAILTGSNFFRADLREAVFEDARLLDASLREANLQNANLYGSVGVQEGNVAGAVLSDVTLPEAFGNFRSGLHFLEETTKTCTRGFVCLLLMCAFVLLTTWSTSDAEFLTNSSSGLPILHIGIPVTSFITFATFFLLAAYVYWHLYADTVWRGIASLPAIFPNGRTLDQELFPWVVNGLIRPNVFHLRRICSLMNHVHHKLLRILMWWIVPLTLGLIWLVMLPFHSWDITGFQIIVVVLSICCAVFFRERFLNIFFGMHHQQARSPIDNISARIIWKPLVIGLIACVIMLLTSDGIINGLVLKTERSLGRSFTGDLAFMNNEIQHRIQSKNYLAIPRTLVPFALSSIGVRVFADISHLDVSERVTVRSQKDNRIMVEQDAKGAQLQAKNLQHLSGAYAFLKKADLQKANLGNATLTHANLEGANLRRADLRGANLRYANLHQSNLFEAKLQHIQLDHANLRSANLFEANLYKASLVGARLQKSTVLGALMNDAILNGADLAGANFGRSQLMQSSFLAAILNDVSFVEANLNGANFFGAILHNANFANASLERTWFHGVDLSRVKNLTQKQLDQACINSKTKLPTRMTRPKSCPAGKA